MSALVRGARQASGTPARSIRPASLVRLPGRNRLKAATTGTSRRAKVSETSVRPLAVLPSAEASCGATPTERRPFFAGAVSSTTNTASAPPTRASARLASSSSRGASSHSPLPTTRCKRSYRPGATRAASGPMLLRSPRPISPAT